MLRDGTGGRCRNPPLWAALALPAPAHCFCQLRYRGGFPDHPPSSLPPSGASLPLWLGPCHDPCGHQDRMVLARVEETTDDAHVQGPGVPCPRTCAVPYLTLPYMPLAGSGAFAARPKSKERTGQKSTRTLSESSVSIRFDFDDPTRDSSLLALQGTTGDACEAPLFLLLKRTK